MDGSRNIKKYKFFFLDIQKEEKWILSIIRQGYRLASVRTGTGRYDFVPCHFMDFEPVIKIDFRTFRKSDEFENYIALFEDSGWNHVSGTKTGGAQYFEKARATASEDIFSDKASRAERYKRIANMWLGLFCVYLPLSAVFSKNGLYNFNTFINWKELYLTPGLWEMTGIRFWRAFLFETPFAFGRGFSGFLFFLIVIFYVFFGIKALYWYYKEKK